MRLILIRHAETARNRGGLAQGRADEPLNENGLAQAEALAAALAGHPIVAVYHSPLRRARQTASAVAQPHGVALAELADLVEMDVGEMDGLGGVEMRERHPDFLRQWMGPEAARVPMPGGESLEQVQERAWAAIEALAQRHLGDTVAAVTHNFVILSLLCRAMDIDLAAFRGLRQDVAAYSVLDLGSRGAKVRRLNDVCHLAEGRLPAPGAFWRRRHDA